MEQTTRVIRVPLTVTVGDRSIEIPVAVPVTFAALTDLVQRHLTTGDEVHGLLLEYYADHAPAGPGAPTEEPGPALKNGRRSASPQRSPRRAAEPADGEAAADPGTAPAPTKGRTRRERQSPAPPEAG